ncbi:hypothetical protein [Actinomycetospora sp. NBRC 106375]|uniref:hypothetical protein n=1 Tax=Actinomycetospora sp. NBRC 106375 TaxID=3032207 RepID=UPI002555FE5E|nr:hypothetical protein [Actinomycetospora sp. NBRC 106375]
MTAPAGLVDVRELGEPWAAAAWHAAMAIRAGWRGAPAPPSPWGYPPPIAYRVPMPAPVPPTRPLAPRPLPALRARPALPAW